MKKPLIFVSTCEFSGDMHGEILVQEIKKLCPEAVFYGIGGSRMAAAGVELLLDPTKVSTIGYFEALKNLRRLKRLINEISGEWAERRPDLVLWLDSGGFNLILAKEARRVGIPVVCMFSPSAWAYGADRAAKLAERVRLLLAVLPFEADFYRKYGARDVRYVGHPLLDRVRSELPAEAYRRRLGVNPGEKLLALLPGSRRQEVAGLLSLMLGSAAILAREFPLKAVIPVAGSIDRAWVEERVSRYELAVRLTSGEVYELLAAADAAVIASGTATLEAAILNVPLLTVYRISKLSYLIVKRMETEEHKKQPWLSLPNLIAGRRIAPELIQSQLTVPNIVKELRPMLGNSDYNMEMRRQLKEVREMIGPPGVMPRAAGLILDLLKSDLKD